MSTGGGAIPGDANIVGPFERSTPLVVRDIVLVEVAV